MPDIPGVTYVTLTGQWVRTSTGTPSQGSVTFRPNQRWVRGTTGETVVPDPLVAELDATGAVSVRLAATDDAGFLPGTRSWGVTEMIDGQTHRYSIFLSGSPSVQSLGLIAPVDVPIPGGLYTLVDAVLVAQVATNTTELANHETRIGTVETGLTTEATRATAAETELDTDLGEEVTRATTAETALHAYVDASVIGLWDDRGDYDASTNLFPSTGGSGTAGAVLKGDTWIVTVAGTLGSKAVAVGDILLARSDGPGQTAGNWLIEGHGLGYVPENVTNKTNDTTLAGDSVTLYPTEHAAKGYTDTETSRATTAETANATAITAETTRAIAAETGLGYIAIRPTDLPNLLAWWDASQLALANNAAVTRWPDLSGNGLDLVQPTYLLPTTQTPAFTSPTCITNAQNGRRVVRFDGVANALQANMLTSLSGPFTVFMVARAAPLWPNTTPSNTGLVGVVFSGSFSNAILSAVAGGATAIYNWQISYISRASSTAKLGVGTPPNDGQTMLITAVWDGLQFAITPPVPASGIAALNATGYPQQVGMTGGTITNVQVSSRVGSANTSLISLGASPGVVVVPPYGSIVLTYSVAPTWTWTPVTDSQGGSLIRVNGVQVSDPFSHDISTTAWTMGCIPPSIGFAANVYGAYMACDIAEVIVVNRRCNPSEILAIEKYLAAA